MTSATESELPVEGAEVLLERANKAFYRVVAVDSAGKHSGRSD